MANKEFATACSMVSTRSACIVFGLTTLRYHMRERMGKMVKKEKGVKGHRKGDWALLFSCVKKLELKS